MYDDIVMDHIKNARNYRVLDDADRHLEGSNPMCGDEMSLYLKLDGGRIADLAFQCTCCGISMASASILTEKVKGASVDEARAAARGFVDMIENAATGPEVPPEAARDVERLAVLETVRRFPARKRCAVLAWRTLAEALEG